MTKSLFILAALLCAVMIVAFIGGLSSGAAALIMLSLLCAGPLFMLCFGMALGRASFEFSVIRTGRADVPGRPVIHNSRLARAKDGGSSYGS
jgi:hypothetical protein